MNDDIKSPTTEEDAGTTTSSTIKKTTSKFLPYITTAGMIGIIIGAFVIGFAIAWSFIKWRDPAPTTYAGGYRGGTLGCYLDDSAFDDTATVVDADWVIERVGDSNKTTLSVDKNKKGLDMLIQKSKAAGINPAILISFWATESRPGFDADGDALGCALGDSGATENFEEQVKCAITPIKQAINNTSPYDAAGKPPGDKNANTWDRLLSSYAMVPMQQRYSDFKYTTEEKDSRIIILKQLVPGQVECRVPGGGLPIQYYSQGYDGPGYPTPPWYNKSTADGGKKIFASGNTLMLAGCGITSTAMVVSYFTGRDILPSQIAEDVVKANGAEAGGNFSGYLSTINSLYRVNIKGGGTATYFSSSVEGFPKSWVSEQIGKNRPIIMRIKEGGSLEGHTYAKGHYVVIRGIDNESNNLIINEPVYPEKKTASIDRLIGSFELYSVSYGS